jgi:exopolysaccharide production protein ExoQ
MTRCGAGPWRAASSVADHSRPGSGYYELDKQQQVAALVAPMLLAIFLTLYVVGDHPFATAAIDKAGATGSGSLLNQFLIFGIFGLALPLMLVRCGGVASLLLTNAAGGLIVAWSLASFIWASHPDLTIRRGIAFAITYLALATLVAAARSTVATFRSLVLVVVALVLLNTLVMTTMPAVSWSPAGEKGIFDTKNVAGTLGMLAVVTLGASLFLIRGSWPRAALAVVYLMSWHFLVATKSKTSLGVAVLVTVAGPFLHTLLGRGGAVRLLALLVVMGVGLCSMVAASAAGVTTDDLLLLVFGDLTFTQRTPIWGAVVRSIADRPWLGYGFGSFWDIGAVLNPLRYAPWDAFYMDAQVINTAHNGYLDQLLQTGAVGFGFGVIAILRCIRVLWGTAVLTASSEERIALLGLLCLAVCLILNNFLESYLFRSGDGMGYLFFLIMLQAEQAKLDLGCRPSLTGALLHESVRVAPGNWVA